MKGFAISFVVIIILAISAFAILNNPSSPQPTSPSPTPSPTTEKQNVNISATFTIITDSITRSFKAEKYHNLSSDVFITSDNPSLVRVMRASITWDDFFNTLPMKLTKDCLITGDGETFCNEQGNLKFYLNNVETPDLLDKEIKEDDKALIKFISA